jgi:hypothetical protein
MDLLPNLEIAVIAMTAPHLVDPARVLGGALADASQHPA